MKILHTSDWHLGKRLINKDRFDEQQAVMQEIIQISNSENVDMVIVAGDLFDTYSPSNAAQRLLYETLQELTCNGTRPVIAIAGNHDSPERIESPNALAMVSGIFFLGYPNSQLETFTTKNGIQITQAEAGFSEFILPQLAYPVRVIFTPFTNQERLKIFLGDENEDRELRNILQNQWKKLAQKYCNSQGVNMLISHLFVVKDEDDIETQEPENENAINVGGASAIYTCNIPDEIQYTALGHLHRCQKIGDREIWYSGSPLEYGFSESEQDKYVIITELEPNKPAKVTKKQLTSGCNLVRKEFENVEETQQWLKDHQNVWVELTIKTDNFLTANELQSIYSVHEKIVTLIPVVKTENSVENKSEMLNRLIHNTDALFTAFFQANKGQKPNENMINLFHEIQSLP